MAMMLFSDCLTFLRNQKVKKKLTGHECVSSWYEIYPEASENIHNGKLLFSSAINSVDIFEGYAEATAGISLMSDSDWWQ